MADFDAEMGDGINPSPDKVIEDQIVNYKNETMQAPSRALDGNFNLTHYIITDIYPKWARLIRDIFQFHESTRNEDGVSERANELFDSLVEAMNVTPEVLFRASANTQSEKRQWMPVLVKQLDEYRRAPWIRWRGNNAFLNHLNLMSNFRSKNWPLNEAAWVNKRLVGNPDFDSTFADFLKLGETPLPQNKQDGRALVRNSVNLTLQAARSLLITLSPINIPLETLINEETRPTVVDHPISDPLFESGTEARPGAIAMQAYLGAVVDAAKSQFPLDGNRSYSGEKRDFGVFADPEQAKEDNDIKRRAVDSDEAETAAAIENTEVASDSAESTGNSAQGSTNGDYYDYTTADADRDIENLRIMAEGRALRGQDEGVTPILPLAPDILQKYSETLLYWLEDYQWAQVASDGVPEEPERIDQYLAELESTIEDCRQTIRTERLPLKQSYTKLKKLKCTAFVLRYARSVHMRLIQAARPNDDLLQARVDRLEDWILHEQVWIDGTNYSLDRAKSNSRSRGLWQFENRSRNNNIAGWEAQIAALRQAIAEKNGQDQDADVEMEETSGEEDAEGDEDAEGEEEEPVQPAANDDNENKGEASQPVVDSTDTSDPPALVLDPFRYAGRMRGSTFSSRKRRREEKPEFTVFHAGGPPEYQQLPQESTYEQLQYIIILTFWRVLQAQLNNI